MLVLPKWRERGRSESEDATADRVASKTITSGALRFVDSGFVNQQCLKRRGDEDGVFGI